MIWLSPFLLCSRLGFFPEHAGFRLTRGGVNGEREVLILFISRLESSTELDCESRHIEWPQFVCVFRMERVMGAIFRKKKDEALVRACRGTQDRDDLEIFGTGQRLRTHMMIST